VVTTSAEIAVIRVLLGTVNIKKAYKKNSRFNALEWLRLL
jgi:hypothetical protein